MNSVIAIHGGAGTISRSVLSSAQERNYLDALDYVLEGGQTVLEKGGSALDAVTEAVFRLEECPLFNAGKGAVFTHEGTHELDASIMDGRTLAAGGVACVTNFLESIVINMRQCGYEMQTNDRRSQARTRSVAGDASAGGQGDPRRAGRG